ncbi:hypothetical protein [Nostoc sp.]|uniref:hypothetical protein n=1 Tax=Nostoc sp. TaxID=1180 RepID=UPI002FFD3695
MPAVKQLVDEQPDAILSELCERLAERSGINVSISTMHRAVQRLELTNPIYLLSNCVGQKSSNVCEKLSSRTQQALNQVLNQIITEQISPDDAWSWFAHCGLFI